MKEKTRSLITLNIEKSIKDLISENNCQIVDIDIKGGKRPLITIYVYDKNGLIDTDRLGKISKSVSFIIEQLPDFNNGFILELSSPGIFRKLKYNNEFNIFINRQIKIVLNNGNVIKGICKGLIDNVVILTNDQNEIKSNIDDIKSALLNG